MPRRLRGEKGKPWLRKMPNGTLRWYMPKGQTGGKLRPIVRRDGTFIDGKANETEAMQVWHEVAVAAAAPDRGDDNEVRVVLDLYLQHLERTAKQKTLQEFLKFFKSFCGRWAGLLVGQLRPFHLEKWWEECHPTWSGGTRGLSATAFQAAMNWAAGARGNNIISSNPLKGMKMPQSRSRGAEVLVSNEDHDTLLAAVPQDLKDVLIALRNTGTRPSVVNRVTARDFYPDLGIWRLEDHKTEKKTGRPLIVPLPPVVVELCKRLAIKYPEGPLFRTAKGEPWYASKLASRILWYKKRLNLDVIAYGYRHSVATELLEKGVPDAHVAAVLGHQDTAMIYRHYGHLGSKIKTLRDILTEHIEPTSQELESQTS